jgi:LmbE family N-acetylglucosaminyl deacetylase
MPLRTHLYLSPHLDDAAYSAGALIFQQTRTGERVVVATVCAGEPPPEEALSPFARSLHARWQTPAEAVAVRRAEDRAALSLLGAEAVYLTLPDCIYRTDPATGKHLYASEESLFGPLGPAEAPLVQDLAGELRALLAVDEDVCVYAPLGIGRHVDHQLTRRAAEAIGLPLIYLEDYPYAARTDDADEWGGLARALSPEWVDIAEADLEAHVRAVAAYRSQLSTFWADEAALRESLRQFADRGPTDGLALRVWA